jgi:hypothetical protein
MTDDLTIISRVASRAVEAIVFPRETYVPKEYRDKPPMIPEGTDLAIWTWDVGSIPYGIAFAGKSNKPLWHYRFRSEAERQRQIDESTKSRRLTKEYKDKRIQERREYKHPYKVGDIFDTSWGYDQTNVDFYQVIEVKGKMLVVREISKITDHEERGADYVVAAKNSFIGPPIRVLPSSSGGIKIEDHYGSLWDGKPAYQTAGGYGH